MQPEAAPRGAVHGDEHAQSLGVERALWERVRPRRQLCRQPSHERDCALRGLVAAVPAQCARHDVHCPTVKRCVQAEQERDPPATPNSSCTQRPHRAAAYARDPRSEKRTAVPRARSDAGHSRACWPRGVRAACWPAWPPLGSNRSRKLKHTGCVQAKLVDGS